MKNRKRAKIPNNKLAAIPKVIHKVVKPPFTTVRPVDSVKRDKPILLPSTRPFYVLEKTNKKYPNKVFIDKRVFKKGKYKKITLPLSKKAKYLNTFKKTLEIGRVPVSFNSYVRYEHEKK